MAASVANGLRDVRVFMEMIKIEHSIFALPFALIGMMWGSIDRFSRPFPSWWIFGWIVVAMVACRSAAMAFNRIVDRDIDALNPRTRTRAIPAGLISVRSASLYFWLSIALFLLAASQLNRTALLLSPVALLVTLGYSLTKRFTALCHFVLGLSLGIAPAASYLAVTGGLSPGILFLSLCVTCWTAGFDIIYSLQDDEFDKSQGLRSIPETVGRSKALLISRLLHVCAAGLLCVAGISAGAGPVWFAGAIFASVLLWYEQSLVRPNDLRKVNVAFFTLNGCVSIGLFGFALVDALQRSAT